MKKHKNKLKLLLLAFPGLFLALLLLFRFTYPGELLVSFLPQILAFLTLYTIIAIIAVTTKYKNRRHSLLLSLKLLIFISILGIFSGIFVPTRALSDDYSLSILSINLFYKNNDYEDIKQYILSTNPDVLVLIEFAEHQNENLKEILSQYPYNTERHEVYGENIIFSKYPIDNTETTFIGKYPAFVTAEIKGFKIYAIHTSAPINPAYFKLRNQYLDILAADINYQTSKKLIVTGDFNLSPYSAYYSSFENKVHNKVFNVTQNVGFENTWKPYGINLLSTHIDHAFISNKIEVKTSRIVELESSDHDGIYLEVK